MVRTVMNSLFEFNVTYKLNATKLSMKRRVFKIINDALSKFKKDKPITAIEYIVHPFQDSHKDVKMTEKHNSTDSHFDFND